MIKNIQFKFWFYFLTVFDFSCFDSLVDFYYVHFEDFNPRNKESCGQSVPVEKIGNLNCMVSKILYKSHSPKIQEICNIRS